MQFQGGVVTELHAGVDGTAPNTVLLVRNLEIRSVSRAHVEARMTAILKENLPALRRFASMLARRADVAEDLVQQTCLRAWIARLVFDESRPARPWLFQIMKNEYLQMVRRVQPITNADEREFDQVGDNARTADQALDLLLLWKHLGALPDDQRRALILVVAVGMSYEEAAEAAKCSAGTIKSRVNRAKQKLREAMGVQLPPARDTGDDASISEAA
jgi:RNA polymerase sigma-70 factor, ECF subfamily